MMWSEPSAVMYAADVAVVPINATTGFFSPTRRSDS